MSLFKFRKFKSLFGFRNNSGLFNKNIKKKEIVYTGFMYGKFMIENNE